MRILQILNRVPWPLKDGGSLGYYNFIKGYADAGCEVDVAALNTSKHYVDMNNVPKELSSIATWHTSYINTDISIAGAFKSLLSSESYHVSRFKSEVFRQKLQHLLRCKQFDVIIFESIFTMPYIDVVRRNSNALIVLRHHNVEYRIWESIAAQTRNPLKRMYVSVLANQLKKFECDQLNAVDVATCVTPQDESDFRKLGCTIPMHVIPASVDSKLIQLPIRDNLSPSLFHIGSMEWQPNIQAMQWFIEHVWRKLHAKYPTTLFHIAGRGMTDDFKRMEGNNIIMDGEVEDAIQFMQSNQIMVVPLFAGSGIRVKILEGMALGKVIVSTSLGAQGIDCEHGKNILIADTADEFCQCIGQLLNNPVLCESLGNEARKLVSEKYSNTKITADVLTFYKQQLARKGS